MRYCPTSTGKLEAFLPSTAPWWRYVEIPDGSIQQKPWKTQQTWGQKMDFIRLRMGEDRIINIYIYICIFWETSLPMSKTTCFLRRTFWCEFPGNHFELALCSNPTLGNECFRFFEVLIGHDSTWHYALGSKVKFKNSIWEEFISSFKLLISFFWVRACDPCRFQTMQQWIFCVIIWHHMMSHIPPKKIFIYHTVDGRNPEGWNPS